LLTARDDAADGGSRVFGLAAPLDAPGLGRFQAVEALLYLKNIMGDPARG
jgi:hypothetical protein